MNVFEIESLHQIIYVAAAEGEEPLPAGDAGNPTGEGNQETRNHFANTKTEALRYVAEDLAQDASLVQPPTVYRCTLESNSRIAMVLALLNGLKPVRVELVAGTLP